MILNYFVLIVSLTKVWTIYARDGMTNSNIIVKEYFIKL